MEMRKKSWLALLLALAIMALPSGALAKSKKPSIKLPSKIGLLRAGDTVKLKPKLKNLKSADLAYESSDSNTAAVTVDGRVEGQNPGRAVVTIAGGGAQAQFGVVVLPAALTLSVGEQATLPRGGVEKYKMKDSKVAGVSSKGVVTGKKAGSTTLAVKYGSQKVNVTVSVMAGAEETTTPAGSKAARLDAASQTDQIVLVEYKKGSSATLSVHEKLGGVWTQLFETSAYVGKNGIGKTKEGDKKTPVGTYNLTTPFGIKADPGSILPYTQVTKYHYWCGASSSEYYNQFVDSRVTGRECTSSDEHLIDYKGVYNYCMFIDYNAEGKPHLGSCIFLHCKGSNKYTAGCVAINESSMKKIIQWARAGAKIVIQKAE